MLFKKFALVTLLYVLSFPLSAQTYWLNMPGSYNVEHSEYTPSVSLQTFDYEACKDALVQYSRDNRMVENISCDVKPLPDAINLSEQWASN